MKPTNAAVAAAIIALTLGLGSCGPAGLVTGASEVSGKTVQRQVFLVFVNDNNETVQLQLNGQGVDVGDTQIAPGASTRIQVRAGQPLRVVAKDLPKNADRPATTWDYRIDANAPQVTSRLGVAAGVFSSRFGKTGSGADQDIIDVQWLDPGQRSFARVGEWGLGFAPDQVCFHPGGGYVYATQTIGNNTVDLIAFRIDVGGGGLQRIVSEFGSQPTNPQRVNFADSYDCVTDPLGRFLWVLRHNESNSRSNITAYAILDDGSLTASETFTRGRLAAFVVSPNGKNAYVAEDLGSGHTIRALRLNQQDGSVDFQINEAPTPCKTGAKSRPQIFTHPNNRFLYSIVADGSKQKLASYFLFTDGSVFRNNQCETLQKFSSLSFDPRGDVLYIVGKDDKGTLGVLRYSIDAVNGALTLIGTQTFSLPVERVSCVETPDLPASAELKNIIYLSQGDRFVPFIRDSNMILKEVKDAQSQVPSIGYGSSASTRTSEARRRGIVTTSR